MEEGPGKGRELVRAERIQDRSGKEHDAIVWVIDDDGDGSIKTGGDKDSDCYVADWERDGIVDRMVDYQDLDGDNDPDEMDIRYFTNGRLNNSWFGQDLDDDSNHVEPRGYEYSGESFFESDPYGNEMIYMDKFDPARGELGADLGVPVRFLRHRRRRLQRGGCPGQRRAAETTTRPRIPTTPTAPMAAPGRPMARWAWSTSATASTSTTAATRNGRSTTNSGSTWWARRPTIIRE